LNKYFLKTFFYYLQNSIQIPQRCSKKPLF